MNHVFWIYPGEVAGRPGPGWAPWQLERLREGGLGAVLSVADGLLSSQQAAAAGLSHLSLPLPEVAPPGAQDAARCRRVLPQAIAFIEESRAGGQGVLVHCVAGRDRTGLVLSAYLAWREGLEPPAAIKKVRAAQPLALSAVGWEELALELIPEVAELGRGG